MKDNFKNNLFYGVLHGLIAFTSIVVVTSLVGFSIPNAFLSAGVGTLLFKLVTKNKIPMLLGISGSYIAPIILISSTLGVEYALGGVLVSGLIYILIGVILKVFNISIHSLLPKWILNVAVILIALNLLPLGQSMMKGNLIVGLSTILALTFLNIQKNKILRMVSVPISILVGIVVAVLTKTIDYSVLHQTQQLTFIIPKLHLSAIATIGFTAVPVIGELFGDYSCTQGIIKKDLEKEVSSSQVLIGNGVATIFSGFFGSMPITSYGENSALLLLTQYFNPNAQIVTALMYILISFATPLLKYVSLIPSASLGAIALYLYGTFFVNAIKDLSENINFNKESEKLKIIAIMITVFYISFTAGGVTISSIAISMLIGIILNKLIK